MEAETELNKQEQTGNGLGRIYTRTIELHVTVSESPSEIEGRTVKWMSEDWMSSETW